ncbi:MAG: universal stress protein [Firmicutes bacterium]|nr:universal stress protein [Bacillota bacterium]
MRSLFDLVIVPVDGSDSSRAALEEAIRAVGAFDGGLIVAVSVVDEDVVLQLSRFETRGRAYSERKLEANSMRNLNMAEKMCNAAGVKMEKVIRKGVPYLEIVEEARSRDATLIVMGKVGMRGPRRILIGSVTERVIEHAMCPVLVTTGRSQPSIL